MGLFSRTSLTAEQISQRQEEIYNHINNDNYSVALNLAKKLNKEAPGEGDGALGNLYFNGWGVQEDYAACIRNRYRGSDLQQWHK